VSEETDDVDFYRLVVRVDPKHQNAFLSWVLRRGASYAEPCGERHVEIRWDDEPDLHTDPEVLEERGQSEMAAFMDRARFGPKVIR
jgi:hypothetical protein